jgi:TfoX/Sxy family transcriptional regulator of competence genes
MANKKINQLVSKTAILSTDIFGIGDATTGQLFKKTIAELQAAIGGAVISVNGLVGTVVLDTDDIQELVTPTNKWFTDARARGAISLTVTGNSGASTYSSGTGVLNIPTYTLAGLGGISLTSLSGGTGITYNNTTGAISYSGTVYTDASVRALFSGSTGISYNSSTGAISYSGTVYTDASVRGLISMTTTGTSGASTYNNTTGVINVPNYTLAGLGGISLTSLSGGTGITYNSSTGAISYSGTVYTDASVRGLISAGTGISYNNTTGVITSTITQYTDALARASVSLTTTGTSGASTYNSTTGVLNIPQYASALSGTTNYVSKFTSSTTIGISQIFDNGTNVGIGTTTPQTLLDVINAGTYQFRVADSTSSYSNGRIYFGGLATADPFYYGTVGWNQSDQTMRIGAQCGNAVGGIAFYTSGSSVAQTEKVRISPTGNLGIGTTTPTAALHVVSTNQLIHQYSGSAGVFTWGQFNSSGDSSINNQANANLIFATNNSDRGRITAGGNWLLGTTSDNGERLYVSGAIRATGTITANSDISLKKNLLKIENALEKVEQINGYTYEFKENDSKRHAGVIAQEIQTVLPEIVNKGNDGILGVEYGNISALLIEAIKEQNIKIKNLEILLASK